MLAIRRLSIALLALLIVGACNCGEDPLSQRQPGTCEPTYECPSGFEYRQGECRASRCQIDTDCCPGQKCNAAAGFCADQFIACTDNSECLEVPGQTCTAFRGGQFCGYPNRGGSLTESGTQLCVSNADCGDGRTCFGGRCVMFAPCDGGCDEGEVCDVDSNGCFPAPTCTESCAPGSMLVVADPDKSSGPSCCAVECLCATLPPVLTGQFGYFAALALPPNRVAVAAYDTVYGDLVVAHFDRTGQQTGLDYVDGFPLVGPIVANPGGPRGGRSAVGPLMGEHASMVTDAAGALHIAYYDRTDGNLRYANNRSGNWKTSIVDSDGDVGLYTSLALAPDGLPRISYMLASGLISGGAELQSAIKYAVATSQDPTGPGNWSTTVVESKPVPPAAGGSVPIDDLYEGVGLFSALAFDINGRALIAYYDRIEGDLRLATEGSDGRFTIETLEGNDPMAPTDVGQHLSLAVNNDGRIGIAYIDATLFDVVYRELGSNGFREVVDDGISPPDESLVGGDLSLLFDANGRPAIAYQDPTQLDLIYARRIGAPAMWSNEVVRGAPTNGNTNGRASGFFASQRREGSRAYLSNVDVSFDLEGTLLLDLSVVPIDL